MKAYIIAPDGLRQTAQVILDSWSEVNLIRKDTADELGLNGKECTLQVVTSGNKMQEFCHQKQVRFQLESLDGHYRSHMITASTAPEITGPICLITLNPQCYPHLKDIIFTEAYPMSESTETTVDIMVGEPLSSDLLIGSPIKGKDMNELVVQKTKLGLCLAGAVPSVLDTVPHVYYSCQTSLLPMEQFLQKFWDLDHIGIHTQRNENLKMEEDLAMQKARALTIKEDGH